MGTETGTSSYTESESSTSTRKEQSKELGPTYEVESGTGKPDYGDMKPSRDRFKLERVKKA